MKRTLLLFILFTTFSSHSYAAIYGHDDRLDIINVSWLKDQAAATAVAIGNNLVTKNADGTFRVEGVETLKSAVNLCKDERFAQQSSLGICTGFLISDRHLVTAGHCGLANGVAGEDANNPFCKAFSWYFNYQVNTAGLTSNQSIPAHHLYTCKKMIRIENITLPGGKIQGTNYGNDFALIELDRPVTEIKPLTVNANRSEIKVGSKVFTIGHPSGLPAKYSGWADVTSIDNAYSFRASLDTQGGNSGSPVFNDKKEVVGILVSGHPIDYYTDKKLNCVRVNVCNADGSVCNENSEFQALETSNSVFYLDTVMRWLPRH